MAAAVRRDDRLRFVWIGNGAQRTQYVGQIQALGVADRVFLTGLVLPSQVSDWMQGFDILVHASQWEGLARALPQSLLLEVPVISFDNDGAPEVVVDHQTGLLVPLNDIEQLTEAILKLARDPAQRHQMGSAGRQKCLEMFDHRRMVDQIESLYERLAGGS